MCMPDRPRFPNCRDFDPALVTVSELDCQQLLQAAVEDAVQRQSPLSLRGSGSKSFFGSESRGAPLDVAAHRGVLSYEPSEMVITARAGTALADIEQLLADNGQMLAFEPPRFGPNATLGGCVATGLSGPGRAARGAVRDFVLGTKIIDGKAQIASFGGQVIKNVAGYDVSRLMCGAFGTLGVLLEVSLRTLPQPRFEQTVRLEHSESAAIELMNRWAAEPLPMTASCYVDGTVYVRLSGAETAVSAAQRIFGGETLRADESQAFWQSLREHTHPGFAAAPTRTLWRLSVPSTTPPLSLGAALIEWNGALRWLSTAASEAQIRAAVAAVGGSAQQFRNAQPGTEPLHPLKPAVAMLHRRLKQAFDPAGVLNPGRMYRDL